MQCKLCMSHETNRFAYYFIYFIKRYLQNFVNHARVSIPKLLARRGTTPRMCVVITLLWCCGCTTVLPAGRPVLLVALRGQAFQHLEDTGSVVKPGSAKPFAVSTRLADRGGQHVQPRQVQQDVEHLRDTARKGERESGLTRESLQSRASGFRCSPARCVSSSSSERTGAGTRVRPPPDGNQCRAPSSADSAHSACMPSNTAAPRVACACELLARGAPARRLLNTRLAARCLRGVDLRARLPPTTRKQLPELARDEEFLDEDFLRLSHCQSLLATKNSGIFNFP